MGVGLFRYDKVTNMPALSFITAKMANRSAEGQG